MERKNLYQRAVDVFLEVVDLEDRERPSILDRACAGDPDLRREVESLLRHHVRMHGGAPPIPPESDPTA